MQRRKTPLMGWASWNAFRTDISEARIERQADLLVKTGLAAHGYCYLNIDDGFFGGRDEGGRIRTHKDRFPNGMKLIADYIHGLGLYAGIYSDGGDNTCAYYYDHEGLNGVGVGLYGHEEEDLELYLAEWGFDFLKADWCGGIRLGLSEMIQYRKIGRIIEEIREKVQRDIIYNVCRWQFPGEWVTEIADSWRIGSDIAPIFDSVMYQLDMAKPLRKYCGPGHVNDLDMLQVGNGMSDREDETHFAMWCMMSTPLMIGCDLEKIREETVQLLSNDELIAINQDEACSQAFVIDSVSYNGNLCGEIWVKDLGRSDSERKAVAFLNRGTETVEFNTSKERIGLSGRVLSVRDAIRHEDLPCADRFTVEVPSHGVCVLVIEAEDSIVLIDSLEQHENTEAHRITSAEVEDLLQAKAILIDVRDAEEYEEDHLPGALSMPYLTVHSDACKRFPDKDAAYVLYCRTGKRSFQAANSMTCLGYRNVFCFSMT